MLFCMLCLHVCVWACLSVALTPEAKSGGGEPIHYASLHTEKGLFVEEGNHRPCESFLCNFKTRCISSTNLTIWNLKEFSSLALFPVSLILYLFFKMSSHHVPWPFPAVVCFLVLLHPLLKSPCWALRKAPPHHGNSPLSGWLHHVTKCFMSHSFHTSLHRCKSTQQHVWTKRRKRDQTILIFEFIFVGYVKIQKQRLHNATPQWHSWKTKTCSSDKWLNRGASLHCCWKQICVCVMPWGGRCQTSLRRWNAGLFGGTGPSVTGCLLRAISQPLVERQGAVSFVSDRRVEDIVFTDKILLMPAIRSNNTLIIFHY